MAGNRIGPRGWFNYTSDTDETYAIFTDVDLATAGGLTAATAGTTEKPRRLQCRYLVLKSTVGTRTTKRLIVNADNALYSDGGSIVVEGESFVVTGRVGEQYTFPQYAV